MIVKKVDGVKIYKIDGELRIEDKDSKIYFIEKDIKKLLSAIESVANLEHTFSR
jgi:hypothetical protein